MERRVIYPVLEGKIAERGIKKSAISSRLNITQKAFRNKMIGVAPFTWPEVLVIQTVFFPDIEMETLMQRAGA